jgi:iron complex transport system permease protein
MKTKRIIVYFCLLLLLAGTIAWAFLCGASTISWSHLNSRQLMILFNIRLPRITAALIMGGGLCVSAALLQASLRNAIADPGIIGLSASANFFAVIAAVLFPAFWSLRLVFALGGSLLSFACLLLWQKRLRPDQLIIAGVALNAVFVALQELISPDKSLASLATSSWNTVLIPALIILICLIIIVYVLPAANLLKVSDAELKSLGQRPELLRAVLLILAAIIAAVSTVSIGVIAFIGIIVPHIGRRLVGHDYRQLIPFSFLAGSWLLLFTDTWGRLVVSPNELPASLLLALVGGPFLIYLLTKRRDRHA